MTEKLERIPLANIKASATNPRKTFSGPDWPEFVSNVKAHGVIQPGVARRVGATVELICGERRFRASKEAGLPDMPLIIRDLTDAQVTEIQQIENLQREDLSVLEEAQGYADWRDSLVAAKTVKTVEEAVAHICGKIHKKRSHVFGRLALLKLSPSVSEALKKGELEPTKAALIAQVPGEEAQTKILERVQEYHYSYRELKTHIEELYRISLKHAPFKTTEVYRGPKGIFADTCTVCPHRTGNMPEAGDNPHVCTNPTCFRLKCDAVASSTSNDIIGTWSEKELAKNRYGSGYVEATAPCYSDDKRRTWSQILGKHAPGAYVAMASEYDDNDKRELKLLRFYKKEDVDRIVKTHKLIPEKAERAMTADDKKWQAEQDRKREAREAKERALDNAQMEMCTVAASPAEFPSKLLGTQMPLWRNLAKLACLLGSAENEEFFTKRNWPYDDHSDQKNLATMFAYVDKQVSEPNLIALTVDLLATSLDSWNDDGGTLNTALKLYGIDWQKAARTAPAKKAPTVDTSKLAKPVQTALAKKLTAPKTKAVKVKASKPAKKAGKKGGAK